MNNLTEAALHEIRGTLCTYVQREDGVHFMRFFTPDGDAVSEMVSHFKYIGENFSHEEVNRILVDTSIFRSPNVANIFREMRAMDRTVVRRAKGRLALIVTITMFNTLINALATGLTRSGDKFRIFGSTELDRAEAWLKAEQ